MESGKDSTRTSLQSNATGDVQSTTDPQQKIPTPPQIPDHTMLRRIGRGSYGEVWLARNIMGGYRAVKVVYRSTFESDKPFEREFQGIQHFEPISRSHPSQLSILHVGRGPGCFYYVMELADDQVYGQAVQSDCYHPKTLRNELTFRGRLPCEDCLDITLALVTALEHLHSQGLVHRDVKPSNIVFVNGIPKLADIGLVTRADATLSFVGTEGFLPPEGPGTPQADLYSLGKMLYEMVTGRDRLDYPDLPTNLAELPDTAQLMELNEIIIRACQPEASKRYPSAAALRSDLELLRSGKSIARLHVLERRLAIMKRVSRLVGSVGLLALLAFLIQSHQARVIKKLADEKTQLANQAQRHAHESQQRLMQIQLAKGNKAMEEGDFTTSMLWLTEALKLIPGNKDLEEQHRFRLGALFRYSPKLIALMRGEGRMDTVYPNDADKMAISVCEREGRWSVQAWNVATAENTFSIASSNLVRANVSKDGKYILTIHHDFTAQIWNGHTGHSIGPMLRQNSQILGGCFNGDGTKVATASADQTVHIWETSTGKLLTPPLVHSNEVTRLSFSPDGSRIVTGSQAVRIWNATTGNPMTEWLDQGHFAGIVEFNPEGSMLLTVMDNLLSVNSRERPHSARIWDASSGQLLCSFERHRDAITHAVFSPSGHFVATASGDRTVMIWNVKNGDLLVPPLHHQDAVRVLAFRPDERCIATSSANWVHLWDLVTGQELSPPLKHNGQITDLHFLQEGSQLMTASDDYLIRIWSIYASETDLPPFASPGGVAMAGGVFTSDGKKVVLSDTRGSIQVFQVDSGQPLTRLLKAQEPDFGIYSSRRPSLSPDGRHAVISAGTNSAWVWNLETGQPACSPLRHSNIVWFATLSPNGQQIATASSDSNVCVWSAKTGRLALPPLHHNHAVGMAIFSPDSGRIATACWDGFARIWDATTGALLTPPLNHTKPVYHVSFCSKGQRLVTAGLDYTAIIWDAITGQKQIGLLTHESAICYASFSPDNKRVVTASYDQTARIWDAVTGRPVTPPLKHNHCVYLAVFSPDGRRLATVSEDRMARIWDASTGESLGPPFTHFGPVFDACFSPDGRKLLTASGDGTSQIWDTPRLDWPLADLSLLTEIYAGGMINATGQYNPSSPERLEASWRFLSSNYPDHFRMSSDDVLRWHQRAFVQSDLLQHWNAALFHLDRLLSNKPEDAGLRANRVRIMSYRSLPRDPVARAALIDLSDYYNASLAANWHGMPRHSNLEELPRGVQHLAGVDFDIRGLVQVMKKNFRPLEQRFPEQVSGITIGRKVRRLHFLQASCGSRAPGDTTIGSYVLHYADGRRLNVPIVYGRDLLDWYSQPGEMTSSNSPEVAWQGHCAYSRALGRPLQLFKATYVNEFPDKEVTKIDFIAESQKTHPFLIALTVE